MAINLTLDEDANSTWYVRAAIRRGIAAVEDTVAEGKKAIDEMPKDTPGYGTWIESLKNMTAYHEQMLSEMKQYIPEELWK